MSYPEVKLDCSYFADGRYTDRYGDKFSVARLAALSKGLPVFDLPVCCIDIGVSPFGDKPLTTKALAGHCKRVQDVNMDYPVILDPDGYLADGWHRLVHALVNGIPTIKAVRLESWPVAET